MLPFRTRSGVLLLDVLIGVAVFSIIVSGVVYALIFAQQSTLKSGDQIRAVYLNQQSIAAVKSIRDTDFADIPEGTFGVRIGTSGLWELSGTGTVSSDGFVSNISITALDDTHMHLVATTSWDDSIRKGMSVMTTDITDWHQEKAAGNWESIALDGVYIDDDTPLFNDVAVTIDYAFVTSEVSDGGRGLYVFDITNTANPLKIDIPLHLDVAAYDAFVLDANLFIVTADTSAEIQIFDISTPDSLSLSDRIATINIPGDGLAQSMAYINDTLFVASQEDATAAEFYSYDVSDLESITPQDSLDDEGSSYSHVILYNGYAYISSSNDSSELRIVDVYDPLDLQFAPSGGGYNLPDTPNGSAIVGSNGYIILGRQQGDITDELHIFDVSESPVPSAAPFNAEAGSTVNALDAEPTGTYAFAATEHDSQELVVLDIDTFVSGGNPIVDVWDTSTGLGRGVHYDALHDRVFFMTNTAVLLLKSS